MLANTVKTRNVRGEVDGIRKPESNQINNHNNAKTMLARMQASIISMRPCVQEITMVREFIKTLVVKSMLSTVISNITKSVTLSRR